MIHANRLPLWLLLAGSCVVGLIACSSDSLWIDEAWVALIASEKDFAGWWRGMQEVGGSTLQMPLYTFYLWVWEKFAGHSEWALRAGNIPFFLLGQWALFRGLRNDFRIALWAVVIAAVSPFIWSYLAEARPYTMQYAAACLVTGSLVQLAMGQNLTTRDLARGCFGLVLLVGASALGFPWAGMAVVAAGIFYWKRRGLLPRNATTNSLIGVTSCSLALILIYDFWTLRHGGQASPIGATDSQNLAFIAYELFGFGGLGPPRLDIRATRSFFILLPYFLPLIALGAALIVAAFQLRRVDRQVWMTVLVYSFVPLLVVTALAIFAPFRLLARHVTPLAPVIFILLAFAVASPARWWMNRIFLPLWLLSAILVRLYPEQRRDDYRAAAAVAKEALTQGHRVWWAADLGGAEYYQLPVTGSDDDGPIAIWAANRADLERMRQPDVVVLSKSDLFDHAGDLQRFLEANHYQQVRTLPAFSIWQKGT